MDLSRSAADRNLLFGIIALQMDFVTRDQFIAGMHAWVLDKSKPLAEILVAQRALGPALHMLLDALVVEHLNQHEDDPQQSLAAISSGSSIHNELKQFADADVQASLHFLPSSSRRGVGDAPTISVGTSTSAGQRFRQNAVDCISPPG